MGDVNFYLKKPNIKGLSLIYLKFKYNGQAPLVYSFGQTINPKNWDEDKHRVNKNKITTADGKHLLNDLLDNLKRVCENAYNNTSVALLQSLVL